MNGAQAVMAAVLAQQTTTAADDTGRTIALVIGALLGLALLLAVLTVWYWRRTDPKKRARAEVPPSFRREPAPATGPARAQAPTGPPRAGPPPAGTPDDRGISDEEWLRLTGSRSIGRGDRSS